MSSPHSKSRRPALQINTTQVPSSKIASSRKLVMRDPKDPTAFNTLSNVYATVVDRSHSTPILPSACEPMTAINTQLQQTQSQAATAAEVKRQSTPFSMPGFTMPETPLSANPMSPINQPDFVFPSTMTATPPLSAGPVENTQAPTFSFNFTKDAMMPKLSLNTGVARVVGPNSGRPMMSPSPRTPRRRGLPQLPYTHPRALQSILRNSPLPPTSARVRQSVRLQEKAARRVAYNSPLEQTITNSKYTFSHVDLLAEDASPMSASTPIDIEAITPGTDGAMTPYAENQYRDGGMTPGPMEDMRRRMASLGAGSSPLTTPGGIRKRKKKDKKRQWMWTINQDEDDDEDVGGAIAAIRAAETANRATVKTPMTAICDGFKTPIAPNQPRCIPSLRVSMPNRRQLRQLMEATPDLSVGQDVDMSDDSRSFTSESSGPEPYAMELDDLTPMVETKELPFPLHVRRSSSVSLELNNPGPGGLRRDSPVPPNILR